MTDRELLELAAKAAGMPSDPDGFHPVTGFVWIKRRDGVRRETRWNPLTDDGDALSLAVKLNLAIFPDDYPKDVKRYALVEACHPDERPAHAVELHGNDQSAAVRRAIVRAAAAIGKALPDATEG